MMSRRTLEHGFAIIDNTFILHYDREVYRKSYAQIDFSSFEILRSNGSTYHYFRDKNYVYIESYMNSFTILPDADPMDFTVVDFERGMATSREHDYVFEKKLPYRFAEVKALSEYYQLVGDKIYFHFSVEVKQADIKSFEVLQPDTVKNVAKDKNHVYFRHEIVEEADVETFHFLDECFTEVYYKECDHTYYAKDKNFAFYIDTIAKSFKLIKSKSLDQFRFQVIDELGYAIDAKHKYLFGKRKSLKD